MKAQTEILVVGTNRPILQTILRLLNKNEIWNATGTGTADEALSICEVKAFKILLLGAGLTAGEEQMLTRQIRLIHPEIKVIPHYGGGSGLLFAEIYLADKQ